MQKIIDREKGSFKLEPSDWWYYAEKLRKQKYDLDEEELKPYFKLDNVRDGAFTLANKLFGMTFSPMNDVLFLILMLRHLKSKADGSHLGVLYMDFSQGQVKGREHGV